MSVDVRRSERGSWCVYVRGNFISDHSSQRAARIVARQLARAEALAWRSGVGLAPDGNDRRPCVCGQPWADSTIHRTDGPCFHPRRVSAAPHGGGVADGDGPGPDVDASSGRDRTPWIGADAMDVQP